MRSGNELDRSISNIERDTPRNTIKIRHLQNKIIYPVQLHELQGMLDGLLSLQTNAVINTTYFDKELIIRTMKWKENC